jgi:hypothetical protein
VQIIKEYDWEIDAADEAAALTMAREAFEGSAVETVYVNAYDSEDSNLEEKSYDTV